MRYDSGKSIQQIVNEQVQQWLAFIASTEEKKKKKPPQQGQQILPCIALSRERGSGGWLIGKELAISAITNWSLFN